ncbi:hypothetical protein K9857_21730 [Pseudomonas sp. REP124]|uniref:hypothetical protein n=1 Tax=Pseudomonas sp. REP124 TaxID=2875731 RepID=UPI001CCC59DA|nr:hypothetical protein [Pseudomonas sp. REP124]MBZ9784161.1 hypothetical protein [Pseudomonas sp. REP124]
MNRVMANEPDLLKKLLSELQHRRSKSGLVDIELVKGYVSPPRLADYYVRGHLGAGLVAVGDTFLDARTMLADRAQKTFAVPIQQWSEFVDGKELLDGDPVFGDSNVTRIEVWPFDPSTLSEQQLILAVAISYSPREWYANERVAGAVDQLIQPLGFFVDWNNL